MALLQDFLSKGAKKIKVLCSTVIISLRANQIFAPIKADIDLLETLTIALAATFVENNMSNHLTDSEMVKAKKKCITQLNVVRVGAEGICNGNYELESETGFTPSKRTRTVRTSIAAAFILEAISTNARGQVTLVLRETVPGNQGYEVHSVVKDGEQEVDVIVGVFKVKSRSLKMLVTNLPSGKPFKIYLITLGTNGVRSTESNMKDAVAL